MTSELVIRRARPEDDAAAGELLVRAFLEQYARKMPHIQMTAAREAELRAFGEKRAHATVWVAEERGQVVGTVTVFEKGSPESQAWISDTADLRHLAVAKSHRGKGLSARLLDTAETHAFSSGHRAVCLHVRKGAVGVAQMYLSRGYVREPRGDLELPQLSLEAFVLHRQ